MTKNINISRKKPTLKMSIFTSESIEISRKITFFWDNFGKEMEISTFRGKGGFFWDVFENSTITLKTKFFAHNLISTIRPKVLSLCSHWKIVFFAYTYIRKYLHSRKSDLLDLFEYIVFCPYVKKYQHSEKTDEITLILFWKIRLYIYPNFDALCPGRDQGN